MALMAPPSISWTGSRRRVHLNDLARDKDRHYVRQIPRMLQDEGALGSRKLRAAGPSHPKQDCRDVDDDDHSGRMPGRSRRTMRCCQVAGFESLQLATGYSALLRHRRESDDARTASRPGVRPDSAELECVNRAVESTERL